MSARTFFVVSSWIAVFAIDAAAAPLSSPNPLESAGQTAEGGYERPLDARSSRPAADLWALTFAGGGSGGAVWSHPGASPCRQPDGSNPCWDEDGVFEAALATAIAAGDRDAAFRTGAFRHAGAAGALEPSAICDGDLIANSGARDGRAFFISRQAVRFDRAWLADQGAEHWITPDGRTCIPTLAYADWHYADICGNVIRLLTDGAPPGAAPARIEAPRPVFINAALNEARPSSRAGPGGVGGGSGGGFGGFAGGARAASDDQTLGVAVFIEPDDRAEVSVGPTPPSARAPALVSALDPDRGADAPETTPPLAAVALEPPPPAIPLPPTFLILLSAIGVLTVFQCARGEFLQG